MQWEEKSEALPSIFAESYFTDIYFRSLLAPTIMLIIFWDILTVEQILLSTQVKQSVVISNKLVYASYFTG